jgi:hypothetical protein
MGMAGCRGKPSEACAGDGAGLSDDELLKAAAPSTSSGPRVSAWSAMSCGRTIAFDRSSLLRAAAALIQLRHARRFQPSVLSTLTTPRPLWPKEQLRRETRADAGALSRMSRSSRRRLIRKLLISNGLPCHRRGGLCERGGVLQRGKAKRQAAKPARRGPVATTVVGVGIEPSRFELGLGFPS